MKLYGGLIAYPIAYLAFMMLASGTLFMFFSVDFVEAPVKHLAVMAEQLRGDDKPYPFTGLFAANGVLIMALLSIGGFYAVSTNYRLFIFAYVVFVCILMAIEIFALIYLYGTVDNVLKFAAKKIKEDYIDMHLTDNDNTNELHRMQQEFICCGWDNPKDWNKMNKSTPGTCCYRNTWESCKEHLFEYAKSRPPCGNIVQRFVNNSKINAFTVFVVLFVTQATLLVPVGFLWWRKNKYKNEIKATSRPEEATDEFMEEEYNEI